MSTDHNLDELIREIEQIKARLSRLESMGSPGRPTIDAVKLYAAKIGLPVEEAVSFFHHYEANGWKVGRVPMKSYESALLNWRKNWQEGVYRADKADAGKPINSIFNLKTILESKRSILAELRNRHAHEVPGGSRRWDREDKRNLAVKLTQEINQLTEKIANHET